ncbi:UNVERIFIED_CONTAM: hypothetical protein Sradi_2513500 [Sesamum radiatum]|uniref:Uncharacterized protein n=1 Tax=Sesamum radiatum TaxID=300843 RepID=A0AAW2SKW1_SESRA
MGRVWYGSRRGGGGGGLWVWQKLNGAGLESERTRTRPAPLPSLRLVLGLEESWQSRASEDCILDLVSGDLALDMVIISLVQCSRSMKQGRWIPREDLSPVII